MENINLIANSGIQFHEVRINLAEDSDAMKVKMDFYESFADETDKESYSLIFPEINYDGQYINPENKEHVIPEDQIYTIKARQALQCFEGIWLPLPCFRKSYSDEKLHDGPTAWSRFWFNPISNSTDYSIVIAFDTKILDPDSEEYLSPTEQDMRESSLFAIAFNKDDNLSFMGYSWIMGDEDSNDRGWLGRIYDQRKDEIGIEKSFGYIDEDQPEKQFVHIALFLTLLKVFDKVNAFPVFQLLPDDGLEIETDLVLDIGNSRSCGLLIETADKNQSVSFTDCSRLEIRDLSIPNRLYNDAFEMRCEFADTSFGDRSATSIANAEAFYWPSLVRVGPEAVRLSIINDSTTYATGMSSPKRYLWDKESRETQWTFNSSFDTKPMVAQNDFSTNHFKINGELRVEHKSLEMGAKYSRSSVMIFALVEIILHAVTQINSYKFRKHHGQELIKRKLKRLVLTCPTAMLETEKYTLRKHAQDAIDVLKKALDEKIIDKDMKVIPKPIPPRMDGAPSVEKEKDWNFDEATCVQLAYLYGEICQRFSNNAKKYFKTMGRIRKGAKYPNQSSLVVGSLDIGGGTTDLMICNYQIDPNASTTVLAPEPLFWEGFNLAGDNILRRLIERIVLPAIRERANDLGCQKSADVMNLLFGPDHGSQSALDRARRQHFACQVALPIALSMVQHASEEKESESRTFDQFFVQYPYPHRDVLDHVNTTFRKWGAKDFNIQEMLWMLNTEEINQVVRQVVHQMLGNLSGVISQFNCDCLLLAGRPTVMPVFRNILMEYLPLTPDRIVLMGRYRIGTWYPFGEVNGLIKDPKTCVSVGASVALMGGTLGRLEGFRIDTQYLKENIKSTANYIGIMNPNTLTISDVLFKGEEDEAAIRFDSPMFIGMRQMDSENWMATPMYRINYASLKEADNLRNKLPLQVTLRRLNPERDMEDIRLSKIVDREERALPIKDASEPQIPKTLKISPQTLLDEKGHWLDSGSFQLAIF